MQSFGLRKHRIDATGPIVCMFTTGPSKSRSTFAKLSFGREYVVLASNISYISLNEKYSNNNITKCPDDNCLHLRCRERNLNNEQCTDLVVLHLSQDAAELIL